LPPISLFLAFVGVATNFSRPILAAVSRRRVVLSPAASTCKGAKFITISGASVQPKGGHWCLAVQAVCDRSMVQPEKNNATSAS
jgi:hypothetical protein